MTLMHPFLRSWIENNVQPWRHYLPESKAASWTTAASDPWVSHVKNWYRSKNYDERKPIEILREEELFRVYDRVLKALSEDGRALIVSGVAIGATYTLQPNACVLPVGGGYVILYDMCFDHFLTAGLHFCAERLVTKQIGKKQTAFRDQYVAAVARHFLACTDTPLAIPIVAAPEIEQATDAWLDAICAFIVAHEIGHILNGDLAAPVLRRTRFGISPQSANPPILSPKQESEFAADETGLTLLGIPRVWEGVFLGGEARGWITVYGGLSLFFSNLEVCEIVAKRYGFKLDDSHPPAAQRRSKILYFFRESIGVPTEVAQLFELLHLDLLDAAKNGALPRVDPGCVDLATRLWANLRL